MCATALIGLLLLGAATADSSWPTDVADNVTVYMNDAKTVSFTVFNVPTNAVLEITSSDDGIAKVNSTLTQLTDEISYSAVVHVTGVFLGKAKLMLSLQHETSDKQRQNFEISTIIVVREERTLIFTISIAVLVSVLYINFGCAMDWDVCRDTLKKPVGPIIGFFCQFLIMPLLSFVIGYILFPDRPELQIGIFFTGISPSGGASNIWTLLLDGNLNLSITMTTLCTIAAFGMMPLWIFTLGRYIFEQGEFAVPYGEIGTFTAGLVIPLAIGFFIQKKLPRVSKILVRIMKPLCIVLIVFIVILAVVTKLYLFQLFSWNIILAGAGLPWLGFAFGFTIAKLCRQSQADVRAISIETGIQNTGVAIFLLQLTLKPPADDLTTVVPASAALMTSVLLVILYLIKLIYQYRRRTQANESLEPVPNVPSLEKLRTEEISIT